MNEKTLRLSLYFLAGVTALYLLATLLRGDSGGPARDAALAGALESVDGASIVHAEIAGPEDTILLERHPDGWTVNGFDADSGAVARFLRAVDEVEVASVAAANPTNHARLGVTADSAWTLSLGGGEVVVLLGKAGSRFRTAYARLPGEDPVSLIRGDLRSAAVRPLLDWRNKIVLRADTGAVESIRITRGGEVALYERQDSTWTVDGQEADAVTVRNLLQELANFRASGFAPEGAEIPAQPDRTLLATDTAGVEMATLLLADRGGNFWAASPSSPYVFEVPTFRADRIVPGTDEE